MATEKNPYDQIPQEAPPSVIPAASETELDATFEVEDDGGVVVDFASEEEEEVSMEPSEDVAEWYSDLSDTLDEQTLVDISTDVRENFQADKDSSRTSPVN